MGECGCIQRNTGAVLRQNDKSYQRGEFHHLCMVTSVAVKVATYVACKVLDGYECHCNVHAYELTFDRRYLRIYLFARMRGFALASGGARTMFTCKDFATNRC